MACAWCYASSWSGRCWTVQHWASLNSSDATWYWKKKTRKKRNEILPLSAGSDLKNWDQNKYVSPCLLVRFHAIRRFRLNRCFLASEQPLDVQLTFLRPNLLAPPRKLFHRQRIFKSVCFCNCCLYWATRCLCWLCRLCRRLVLALVIARCLLIQLTLRLAHVSHHCVSWIQGLLHFIHLSCVPSLGVILLEIWSGMLALLLALTRHCVFVKYLFVLSMVVLLSWRVQGFGNPCPRFCRVCGVLIQHAFH